MQKVVKFKVLMSPYKNIEKKKRQNRENGQKKAQKGKKAQIFSGDQFANKTKKISIAKLNSVQLLERYSLSHKC